MHNSIKTVVIASISIIGILLMQACKKEKTGTQGPVIQFADELQPEPGQQYVLVDSGMAIHVEFTATDENNQLTSGAITIITESGQTLYDTAFTIDHQSIFLFHQHYYPAAVADTTHATVTVTVTDNINLTARDSALVAILP